MQALIIGGAGFVGSYLAAHCMNTGKSPSPKWTPNRWNFPARMSIT